MKGLTDKQRSIIDFIEDFIDYNSMAPTVYEIANHFKIKTSTVFAHIRALQRKNYLTRSSKARSLSVIHPRKQPRHMSFVLPLPLLGRINAGLPADSVEFKEGEIYFDRSLLGAIDHNQLFGLKIAGESMRDLGILDGDVVIIKQTRQVKDGDVVVALVRDETTVKSFYQLDDGRIELRPANPDFKPQIYLSREVSIQGTIIALQRKY